MTRNRKSASKQRPAPRSTARTTKRKPAAPKAIVRKATPAPVTRTTTNTTAETPNGNPNQVTNNVIPFRRFQPWSYHPPLNEGSARRGYARSVSPLRHSRGK